MAKTPGCNPVVCNSIAGSNPALSTVKAKFLILALFLCLPACGKTSKERAQELLWKFEDDAAKFSLHVDTDRVKVVFVGSIKGNFIGTCNLATKEIALLRSYWRSVSGASQEVLLYHELGHCVLDRGHNNNHNGPNGFPSSIMNRLPVQGAVYENHRDYYLKELFQGG